VDATNKFSINVSTINRVTKLLTGSSRVRLRVLVRGEPLCAGAAVAQSNARRAYLRSRSPVLRPVIYAEAEGFALPPELGTTAPLTLKKDATKAELVALYHAPEAPRCGGLLAGFRADECLAVAPTLTVVSLGAWQASRQPRVISPAATVFHSSLSSGATQDTQGQPP
jgi:hypothetical protein